MEWFMKCINQYTDFSGRARRKEYWMFYLFYFIFLILTVIVDIILMALIGNSMPLLTVLFVLGTFVPFLAVTIRRLHDTDRSGWWMLITFVPLVGGFIFLFFTCVEGTLGANRFGANPKA
ncbi:MAG: hypothetical protein RL180_1367 [Pseudomonadota bacterium]|jgi:uncharacterized membrane protein YhaH (DUF805 family)